jgi:hypothetical protein
MFSANSLAGRLESLRTPSHPQHVDPSAWVRRSQALRRCSQRNMAQCLRKVVWGQQAVHVRGQGGDRRVVEGQGARQLEAQLAAEGTAQLHRRPRIKGARHKGSVITCTPGVAFEDALSSRRFRTRAQGDRTRNLSSSQT